MLPGSTRIFVCTTPQDMRRSFDALAACAKQVIGEDPRSGALFVFVGKSGKRLKVLWWDRNGYCLLYKKLHQARFIVPCAAGDGARALRIDGRELAALLAGVEVDRKHDKAA